MTRPASEMLSPVEIRVLAFLGDPGRRFIDLEDIVLGTGDPLFSVKAALAFLCRRAYATGSARRWACTGLGSDALNRLSIHQVREAQLLEGDDASELALRRMGAHGGRRHG